MYVHVRKCVHMYARTRVCRVRVVVCRVRARAHVCTPVRVCVPLPRSERSTLLSSPP